MKKFFSIFTTVLLVIVLLLAFALVGVRLFGIAPYTVLSGSMEPTYHVGSLIYVKKIDPGTLKVNDPVTYVIDGGTVVTHRIVRIIENEEDPSDLSFKVKGDANKIEDGEPVRSENVLGKPIFTIPLLGYVAYFIQNPPGSYLAIGACVVIVLLTFLPDLLDKFLGTETPKAVTETETDSPYADKTVDELRELLEKARAESENGKGPPGQAPPGQAPPSEAASKDGEENTE